MRPFTITLFIACTFPLLAQSDTTRAKVVKSAPMELKAAGNVVATSVSSTIVASPPVISGDFTMSSAHPKCAQSKSTTDRATCTADEVKAHILQQPGMARPKSMDEVTIDFDVDEYGDVKSIRSNTGSEPAFGKALIVALSSLPKFEPARKGEARAASHCGFSYAVSELFPEPAVKPSDSATAQPEASGVVASPPAPALAAISSNGHLVTGDLTLPSFHPACVKARTPEDKVKCTADEVLKQIKGKLSAEQPAYLDEVVVDLDVDVYGDVKTIRTNCSSEPELGRAIITALYGLPKFTVAKKGDARAASHYTFKYTVTDLFTKP